MHLSRKQNVLLVFALAPVVLNLLINGFYVAALARSSLPIFWLADFIQWIVLPITLLILLYKKASILPKHYGLDTSALRWQSPILGTLGVFISCYLSFSWVSYLSWQWLGQPSELFRLTSVFPSGLWGTITWIYSAVTAGIIESIFFISLPWLLYHNVRNTPSKMAFTILVSLVFAAAHWEQGTPAITASFAFNLIACFWFFQLGTLWPVAAGHILVDLVAFL